MNPYFIKLRKVLRQNYDVGVYALAAIVAAQQVLDFNVSKHASYSILTLAGLVSYATYERLYMPTIPIPKKSSAVLIQKKPSAAMKVFEAANVGRLAQPAYDPVKEAEKKRAEELKIPDLRIPSPSPVLRSSIEKLKKKQGDATVRGVENEG